MAVSPERAEFSKQMKSKHDLTFEILRDEGNELADKFGIKFKYPDYLLEIYKSFGTDLKRYNGDESETLPMPARYVIDQSGVIRAAEVHPDYTKRPEPSQTVEELKKLKESK